MTRKCRFYYGGQCEHGLTHDCPMWDDNEETCCDFEKQEDKKELEDRLNKIKW